MLKRTKLASALAFLSAGLLFTSAALAINNDLEKTEVTKNTGTTKNISSEENNLNTYDNLLAFNEMKVEEEKDMPTITEESKYTYLEVNVNALNIRTTPGTENKPVGTYRKHSLLIAHAITSNGWYRLSNGKYISAKYVNELNISSYDEFVKLKEERAAKRAAEIAAAKAIQEKQNQQQVIQTTTGKSTYSSINMTKNEYEILAKLIKAEAGGESFEGQVAVAKVVFNRVLDKKFPNTVNDVIFAKNQFVPAGNGTIHKKVASNTQYKAIETALASSDNLGGATFFYAPSLAKSAWHESLKTVAVIGVHHFKVN